MTIADNHIKNLNQLLEQCLADEEQANLALRALRNNHVLLNFILVDLSLHTPEFLQNLRQMKLEAAKALNFETAAYYRTLEDESSMYLDLKESLGIDSPGFRIENQLLFFFYFGKSQTEQTVKKVFELYEPQKIKP